MVAWCGCLDVSGLMGGVLWVKGGYQGGKGWTSTLLLLLMPLLLFVHVVS